jgi:hypothetical protein
LDWSLLAGLPKLGHFPAKGGKFFILPAAIGAKGGNGTASARCRLSWCRSLFGLGLFGLGLFGLGLFRLGLFRFTRWIKNKLVIRQIKFVILRGVISHFTLQCGNEHNSGAGYAR